ncbi:MAG TPA: hypothetical protein VHW09_27585 [Bryobacteraceae bacterium]|nr:hypothetical protein [Bryobacteraceae bacterium]
MGKPKTLLQDLCRHTLACGAESIEVEHKDRAEWILARKGETVFRIATFVSAGRDAKELRENLAAVRRKPLRTAIAGQVWILTVEVYERFGEDAFRVRISQAPQLDPAVAPKFTKKQGQYLAFIHHYSQLNRRPPSEADMERYFGVTPPSVHQMIVTLELKGLIERTPGQGRSIDLKIPREQLPELE